jgi:hypothetical protein
MEKDLGKIQKNPETDIIVRIDDFGGKRGLTIREFVHSERYTGFTKAGVRIRAENFDEFKAMVNSIDPEEMKAEAEGAQESLPETPKAPEADEEQSGIDEEGLM